MTYKITHDIKPSLDDSLYVEAFDEGLKVLDEKGYSLVSAEDLAGLRIRDLAGLRVRNGLNHSVSINGSWTREAFVYDKEKGIYLTPNSPIMKNPIEATNFHRNGGEFYLSGDQLEESLVGAIKIKDVKIPTSRFSENELTNFVFGKMSGDYGRFLEEAGIKEIQVYLTNVQDKTFARQLWLCGIGGSDWSGLDGYSRGLVDAGRMRGVKE